MQAAQFVARALDLCLPALCPACHCSAGAELCASCLHDAYRLQQACSYCGTERARLYKHTDAQETAAVIDHENNPCAQCKDRGFAGIKRTHVIYAYSGIVRDLVLQAKVKSRRSAQRALCQLLPHAAAATLAIDAVVVIPPSPGRRYGPHLATQLARSLAQTVQKPLRRVLRQTRLPAAQHELPAHMRKHNTNDLFTISQQTQLPARILLVDDLITSGNTLEAAAQVLRQQGAQEIHVAAVARTIPGRR